MSDKIEKIVKLYGKITGKRIVPRLKIENKPVVVKKREIPKPNHK